MDPSSAIAPAATLARFASKYRCADETIVLDKLTQRHGSCSRELPKCGACKPWPGKCDYSRDKPKSTTSPAQTGIGPKSTSSTTSSPIEQRLQNIEVALQKLTETVEKALGVAIPRQTPESTEHACSRTQTSDRYGEKEEQAPGLFIGPSNSFSFLKEASDSVRAATRSSSPLSHPNAQSELQFLSTSLTTATTNTENVGDMTQFYIPSKAAGYRIIGDFLEHAATGEPLFRTPSDNLLKEIIFNPGQVTHKAWVVYVNYIMLAQVSTEKAGPGNQAEKFRRNVRIALNDSSIFLEPREINVQALTLLAFHGEDYASPNLSWMLVGHACRQAEALGLHASTHPDPESRQRSLFIFWLLFIVDKSCSLAFGRSPFLPVSLYQDVPLPEFVHMLKFQPHTDAHFTDSQTVSKPSHFGAHFFTKGVELAKIMGLIIDLLSPGPSAVSRQEIRTQLEQWYEATMKILNETVETERQFLEASQRQEMYLGLNSLRFQYLHIVVILLKGDESSGHLRLEAAREALFLLPSVVSNWSSVYNGVIWHLLYYPFISFFVVFENLVHNHHRQSSIAIDRDLKLLSTTVSYFESMRAQMRLLATLCSRLERVAAVFLQLAKNQISQQTPCFKNDGIGNPSSVEHPFCSTSTAFTRLGDGNGVTDTHAGKEDPINKNQSEAGPVFWDDAEFENFLSWLPADTFATGPFTGRGQNEAAPLDATTSAADVPSLEGSRGRKRPLDATFDWFSWDAFYSDTDLGQRLP
ncbi:hypothetical protein CH063_03743 [Colletotrichum higginsianum]|uniref:Fungal specific transcription factor domain-containing protein n=1 Tax=Colletotrichum higginsianum (strain IMI 349063) TaxID=759273 RepID=H1W0F0_COLHI|nr:Fungal specific transcription factor domain-containing protein [Colletotrichum higginsianum IMI 349063]OBR14625.1 Fungal specific transcription factor domain-containing protein [Colletotrichum higginsianum IMI 349063]CCF45963.1 hypothetical protein CH063_03743 [Colletotrichum higginsianum]